ncbi:MAG TPA: hypothetical protein VIU38_09150 [Anaerolineales bacterium]
MLSSNATSSNISWLAFAVGAVTLLGLALLILMYVLKSGPLGMLNDICNGLGAALSVALAAALFSQHQARSPQLAVPTLILVVVGAIIAIAGSVLVISGATGFFLAGMYTMLGYALIGIWVLSLNHSAPWPASLTVLGLVAGGAMVLGLATIPSIFMRIDSFQAAAWHTWLGQVGFLGWAILYPIWCLRLWQVLRTG